ncbi:unnamed protein product [Orchesella dallaii]|uniref:Eph LBD domain-containing protein n=1 Tax=Orchesella dallaii TaxID=48710 RepID=A0ABP1S4E3_9HEXA
MRTFLVLCSSSIISAFNGWSIPDEAENSDIEGWPAESDNQGEEEAWSGWGSNFEDGEGWGWPSNSENDEFRESRQTSSLGRIAVAEHNKYRRRHKVPNLQGSSGLDASAQKYANYLASINVLKHSDNRKYGENLATSFMKSKEAAVRDAIKRWYDEIKDYKWGNPGFSLKTGHFTAVVWKATKQVGIGVAQNSKTKKYFVVAHYSPPGNMNNAVALMAMNFYCLLTRWAPPTTLTPVALVVNNVDVGNTLGSLHLEHGSALKTPNASEYTPTLKLLSLPSEGGKSARRVKLETVEKLEELNADNRNETLLELVNLVHIENQSVTKGLLSALDSREVIQNELIKRFLLDLASSEANLFDQKLRSLELIFQFKPELIEFKLGQHKRTPLQLVAEQTFENGKQLELIQMLIDNKANVNSWDHHNSTVLHWAVYCNASTDEVISLIKLLIESGAEPNSVNKWKETFVHYARYFSRNCALENDTLQIFQSNGVDFNAKQDNNLNVLDCAVANTRDVSFLKTLIAFGADWESKRPAGETILHFAAYYRNLPAFKLFKSFGINVNAADTGGGGGNFFVFGYRRYREILPRLVLLDTTQESSLAWHQYPQGSNAQTPGWNEESFTNFDKGINWRSYAVCDVAYQNVNNWLWTPFIERGPASRIYIEIQFSMRDCNLFPGTGLSCKETFSLLYYEFDAVTDEPPPLHWEHSLLDYTLIDRIAADEGRFTLNNEVIINTEVRSIPVVKKGVYFAFRDQGACISLLAIKVYYITCPEVTASFAFFPATPTCNRGLSYGYWWKWSCSL